MIKYQKGTNTVEFAIVGALFFMLLFAVLEVGRLFWTIHGVTEATRRGARVAAVCPMHHPAITNVAAFGDPATGAGGWIPALTPADLTVTYIDSNGAVTNNFLDVSFVRVAATNYQFQTVVPGFFFDVTLPDIATTMPRESLGVPRDGAAPECPF